MSVRPDTRVESVELPRPREDTEERSFERLLTAEDVAALLGVTAAWVYDQARRGRMPTVALGRYRRFRREALEEWLLAHER